MRDTIRWIEKESQSKIAITFVKTVLKYARYKVMKFGIENHNKKIVEHIRGNYKPDTNLRLMCMPDLVVVDPKTKIAELIEVKWRPKPEYFSHHKSDFAFKYRQIFEYQNYWGDMTLAIVMNVAPYCLCVRMKDIDYGEHFIKKSNKGSTKGHKYDLWNFNDIYKDLKEIFPKVSDKYFDKTVKDLNIATDEESFVIDKELEE